jgi:hypothetical protein
MDSSRILVFICAICFIIILYLILLINIQTFDVMWLNFSHSKPNKACIFSFKSVFGFSFFFQQLQPCRGEPSFFRGSPEHGSEDGGGARARWRRGSRHEWSTTSSSLTVHPSIFCHSSVERESEDDNGVSSRRRPSSPAGHRRLMSSRCDDTAPLVFFIFKV